MNYLETIRHHATLFVHPDRKSFVLDLWKKLQSDSIAHVLHDETVLDIKTARSLTSWANTPYAGEKTALISFHTITIPAQNALLKIVEEPRKGVRFIFVTTNKEAILPTLYSRLEERVANGNNETEAENFARLFLQEPQALRMKLPFVTELLSLTDEEGRKDREKVKSFVLSLGILLGKSSLYPKETLETLEMASYAGDSSSSGKAILEYLSLLLPRTKG